MLDFGYPMAWGVATGDNSQQCFNWGTSSSAALQALAASHRLTVSTALARSKNLQFPLWSVVPWDISSPSGLPARQAGYLKDLFGLSSVWAMLLGFSHTSLASLAFVSGLFGTIGLVFDFLWLDYFLKCFCWICSCVISDGTAYAAFWS